MKMIAQNRFVALAIVAGAFCSMVSAPVAHAIVTEERSPTPPQQTMMSVTPYHSAGTRLSLVKPVVGLRFDSGAAGVFEDRAVNVTGLSLGYSEVPIRNIGWGVEASLFDIEQNDHVGMGRVGFNVGYGLDSRFALKAGSNVSSLFGKAGLSAVRPSFGFQAGVGYQSRGRFGADLGIVQMNQTANGASIVMTGIELALSGSF